MFPKKLDVRYQTRLYEPTKWAKGTGFAVAPRTQPLDGSFQVTPAASQEAEPHLLWHEEDRSHRIPTGGLRNALISNCRWASRIAVLATRLFLDQLLLLPRRQFLLLVFAADLKFDTRSRPSYVSADKHKEAKRAVLVGCAELGVRFIAYVVLHEIARGRSMEEKITFGANTVFGAPLGLTYSMGRSPG